jgi:hypothetical protein
MPDSITVKTRGGKIEKLGHTATSGYGRDDRKTSTGPKVQPRSPK